jgi:hypothetical protein
MSSDITFINKVQEALTAGKVIGDGHTLFAPEFYEPYFTAEELAHLIRKHESDGASWKSTIFDEDGNVIPELEAIYNLDFLYWLAGQLGVTERTTANGRGSQAQQLVGFIREVLV